MTVLAYVPCRCGCRAPDAPEPCACRECAPGPGLDHAALRWTRNRPKETRMMHLLHQTELTLEEQAELDGLLDWYVHRD